MARFFPRLRQHIVVDSELLAFAPLRRSSVKSFLFVVSRINILSTCIRITTCYFCWGNH